MPDTKLTNIELARIEDRLPYLDTGDLPRLKAALSELRRLRAVLSKIANRTDDEMRTAATLHYDMRGWAGAALAPGHSESAEEKK